MSTGSSELSDECHFGQGWAGSVDCATNMRVEADVSYQLSALSRQERRSGNALFSGSGAASFSSGEGTVSARNVERCCGPQNISEENNARIGGSSGVS